MIKAEDRQFASMNIYIISNYVSWRKRLAEKLERKGVATSEKSIDSLWKKKRLFQERKDTAELIVIDCESFEKNSLSSIEFIEWLGAFGNQKNVLLFYNPGNSDGFLSFNGLVPRNRVWKKTYDFDSLSRTLFNRLNEDVSFLNWMNNTRAK